MPRTWQYSRWRRLVLQGAMCLLLGMSVGAAAWIVQKRRPAMPALGEVTQHGILKYRLPVGWEVEVPDKSRPSNVVADEPGAHGRTLRISVEPRRGRRTDADVLVSRRSRGVGAGEPVRFLEQEGVLAEARFRNERPGGGSKPVEGDGEEEDYEAIAMPGAILHGVLAAVVLEDGTGVVVSLEGEAAAGPSNRGLVKQFIGSMRRVSTESNSETRPASQKRTP